MTDCRRLSDRTPDVVIGRAQWTSDEIGHLSSCRSCRAEWELVRMAHRLGGGWGSELDAAALSHAVLQRLEHARVERARRGAWTFAGLVAAAMAAVLWMGQPVTRPALSPDKTMTAALQIPLPELDSLQPAELDSVLQTMDEAVGDGSTLDTPELGDVDGEELQSVLDVWEG
jgi:hypothetical protein